MKKLVLTGLATEHDFSKGGEEQYYLVFNGGEVRIPVPQETAEAVIRELYGSPETTAAVKPVDERGYTDEAPQREQIVMAKVGNTFDDDGVDQV